MLSTILAILALIFELPGTALALLLLWKQLKKS